MRRRRWVSILALIGVLLHAGAIVRHNAAMIGANLQYQGLLTDLLQICHGDAGGSALAVSDLPYVPKPSDAGNGCPLCSGLGTAVALAAPESVVISRLASSSVAAFPDTQASFAPGHAVCPPARGPPAFA